VETTPVAMLKMVVDMTAGIDATAHLIINASAPLYQEGEDRLSAIHRIL
jgi:hypothetical protein